MKPKKQPPVNKNVRNKYLKSRIIIVAIIAILYIILAVDAKTGFIKSLVGDKTLEVPVPRWLKKLIG